MLEGEVRMRTARPDEINGAALDRFSIIHFSSGVATGMLGTPAWAAAVGSVLWEFIERPLKDHFPEMFPHPLQDRLTNATTDTIFMMAGWWAGRQIREGMLKAQGAASESSLGGTP